MRCSLTVMLLLGRMIAAHPVAVEQDPHLSNSRVNATDRVFGDVDNVSNDENVLNFQVAAPILIPSGVSEDCVVTLAEHAFANSYYQPFVGSYTPPPCTFNRVSLNFTVHTFGAQQSRMGTLFLGDHEIFRYSTAEPGGKNIAYTHWKEVDNYLALWKEKQTIILDLPNIVEGPYDGILYVTLTAVFYQATDGRATADIILPISTKASSAGQASTFEIPQDAAVVSYRFPTNVSRAVVGIAATGQQTEALWFTNALTSDHKKPKYSKITNSHSPYREVQLMIDGQLAGIVQPFPTVSSNGINPAFWRPMVGNDVFDIRQYQIEITPWLGRLCDGEEHIFEIQVCGLEDDGNSNGAISRNSVGKSWIVSGNIFLFAGSSKTTDWMSDPIVDPIQSEITIASKDEADTLSWKVDVTRKIKIAATLKSNSTREISWIQSEIFKSQNAITGLDRNEGGKASGNTSYWSNGSRVSKPVAYINLDAFSFGATWDYKRMQQGLLSIEGTFHQMQSLFIVGAGIFPNRIPDPSLGGIKSQCVLPTDYRSFPRTMYDRRSLYPEFSQLATYDGRAKYIENEDGKGHEGITNDMTQFFHHTGSCFPFGSLEAMPLNGTVEELARARSGPKQQIIEKYYRFVNISNEDIVREYEQLQIGNKSIPIPSIGGILSWRRPVTPSLANAPKDPGQPSQPGGSDALLQAILGVGTGEVGPGYQTRPGYNNSTEPNIQPIISNSSIQNNPVVPVDTFRD